ncbi:MAG: hypothetical protein ABSC06_39280 [Rhodopila sp.]|jgi:hypothetical protein
MSDIPNDLPTRVAVLDEIARGTKAALERIERRLDSSERRMDDGFRSLAAEQRADFRWLLGVMIGWGAALLGVMAHGFHWL